MQVPESEVASDLGFKNIYDYRCWQTIQGFKISELEHELIIAKDNADQFKWVGKRMQIVLEKLKHYLLNTPQTYDTEPSIFKLLLAIDVVCGTGVDWNNLIKPWFDNVK